ncbi:PREDICTED: vitellogenin-2-like [Ipomoea nil]|uniref:vitellogenin-2-like n=1 Tax=Ipomoea nil TaxID=35883 RepID=UPI0009010D10|nr:PREDICTED: vitellogenin-2-like [Ipomoea nil]
MTDSDSQNASIGDYDEEVEYLSDEEVDIMSYSPEDIHRPAPAPERISEQNNASSSSGSSSSSSSGSGSSSEEEEEGASSDRQAMAEFGDEDAPLPPPAKISLGGKKKAKVKPAGEKEIPSSRPLSASTVTTAEGFVVEPSDVLVTRVEVARGKEKAELEKAQKGLKKSEEDRVLAEKVAQRAIGEAKELKARLDNPSELVQSVFKDSESGSAFLTAARGTKVGEDLILSFGRWAFKAGQRKMLERARTRMEQALEGDDLQLVLSTLPPDLADPGPSPFAPKERAAEPGGSSAATPSGKEAAARAQEVKK